MSQVAITQSWEDSQRYINEQVRRARLIDHQHRHDADDFRGEAAVAFLQAYASFEPGKGSFLRRVSFLVWYALLRLIDQTNKRHGRELTNLMGLIQVSEKVGWDDQIGKENGPEPDGYCHSLGESWRVPCSHRSEYACELLDELGEDASMLVSLVLDTPDDLRAIMNGAASSGRKARTVLKKYVTKDRGWTMRRWREAFTEVQDALWLFSN